jgi:hypothetical protein
MCLTPIFPRGRSERRALIAIVSVLLCATCFATSAVADSPIIRVEEDWELVVSAPDINSHGPQVACVLSPFSHLDSHYITFEINHCSAPVYSGGGVCLQVWRGEQHFASRTYRSWQALATSGETVRWTQTMEIQDGQLVYEIVNGHSSTWGDFGGQGTLKAQVAFDVTDLAGYTPDVSIRNSGVTFASHCVQQLELKTVRAFRQDGSVVNVDVSRLVYEQADDES